MSDDKLYYVITKDEGLVLWKNMPKKCLAVSSEEIMDYGEVETGRWICISHVHNMIQNIDSTRLLRQYLTV